MVRIVGRSSRALAGAPSPRLRRLIVVLAILGVWGTILQHLQRVPQGTRKSPVDVGAQQSAAVRRWSSVPGAVSSACAERSDNGVRPCVQSLLDFATKQRGTGGEDDDVAFPSLRAVQVGACDGDFRKGDELQAVLLPSPTADVTLVEAVPTNFERLVVNLAPWRELRTDRDDSLVPLNAAMCPPNEEDNGATGEEDGRIGLPFFSVSPKFAEDHPEAEHWKKYQLGNLATHEKIVNHLLPYEKKTAPEGTSDEALRAAVWEKYVMITDVPCYSPEKILSEGRSRPWSPEGVDILMVDTEGMDDVVVSAWLSLPGFLPALIIYEHQHVKEPGRTELRGRLAERGYDCKVSVPNTWADTICILQ